MFHVKHKIIAGFGRVTGWILGLLLLPAIWTVTAIQHRRQRKEP